MIRYEQLLGRQFEMGSFDCYSLLRDFYKDNYGILLTDYARPDRWWEEEGFNLYYDNFQHEGFTPVDVPLTELHVGDCLFIALNSKHPNHCGVYIGHGKIVHHMYRQLSKIDYLRGLYRNNLVAVIRHKDVKPELPVYEKVDLRKFRHQNEEGTN